MTIEKNIPIPGKDKFKDFDLHKLKVGHSVFYPGKTKAALSARLFKWRLENDIKLEKKFIIREMHGGARIWRINK